MGALNWNPEITNHNQRIHMAELAAKQGAQPGSKKPTERKPFAFADAVELMDRSYSSDYLIKTLFEKNSLIQIFGATGGGKSFVVLDIGYCIATGIPFHGLDVQQGNVAYICGEGKNGIGKRVKALLSKYKADKSDIAGKLFVSEQPGAFIDDGVTEDVATAIKALGGVVLVIVDTYHRNMGGGNENSADDFGLVLRNIDKHLKPLNVAVLIVHHSGHMDTDRSRGSSAIRAAMDAEYQVFKNSDTVTMKPTKIKDGATPATMFFNLVDSEIGTDEDGEIITSAYLETKEGGADAKKTNRHKLSARDDAILTSLDEAVTAHGIEPPAEIKAKFGGFDALWNKDRKIAHVDHWRELAYQTITIDNKGAEIKQDSKLKQFKRTREKLHDGGFIVVHGDYAWRKYPEDDSKPDTGQSRTKPDYLSGINSH